MTNWTTLQTLAKVHRELWWVIRLVGSLEVQLDGKSESWKGCVDVQDVLRSVVKEVERIIQRERDKEPNQRNHRQAEDLALKAQLAKARSVVAEALNEREDGHSHK